MACEDTGINLDGLVETFHDLHIASLEGRDCFGKTFFPVNFEAEDPIWVAIITPAVHYTMGGIRINGASEVSILHFLKNYKLLKHTLIPPDIISIALLLYLVLFMKVFYLSCLWGRGD